MVTMTTAPEGPVGTAVDIAVCEVSTHVGSIALAVTRDGLIGTGWCSSRLLAATLDVPVVDEPERLEPVITQVLEYFDGSRHEFDFPIDWRASSGASLAVRRALYETVGYGETVTYGELALRSGTDAPARAVGTMMARNPIGLVVPCHRVVASTGMGGFSGGDGDNNLEVKRWLLAHEGALAPTLFDVL